MADSRPDRHHPIRTPGTVGSARKSPERALGAEVRRASCDIFSTWDHAAAATAVQPHGTPEERRRVPVFAWKDESRREMVHKGVACEAAGVVPSTVTSGRSSPRAAALPSRRRDRLGQLTEEPERSQTSDRDHIFARIIKITL
jgi:hypothetical protein